MAVEVVTFGCRLNTYESEAMQRHAEEAGLGEVVIVVGPPMDEDVTDATIAERLAPALESLSLRDATKMVSDTLKVPKARVYDIALDLKRRK